MKGGDRSFFNKQKKSKQQQNGISIVTITPHPFIPKFDFPPSLSFKSLVFYQFINSTDSMLQSLQIEKKQKIG